MKPLTLREFILSPRFDPLIRGSLREKDLEMAVSAGEEDDAMLPFMLPPAPAAPQEATAQAPAPEERSLQHLDTEC